MARPPMLAVLATALALGNSGIAATTASPAPAAPSPAPPPGMYCRVSPEGGWPDLSSGHSVDLSGFQDYRQSLDIPPGTNGAGVTIADVEYEWDATHVDLIAAGLPEAQATNLGFDTRNHGTAVLGILGATDDGLGITGLASAARLRAVSPIDPGASSPYDPARAITEAAASLGPGDVLLVEQQADLDVSPDKTLFAPIESYKGVRDEIAEVVGRGIVVVEPAGNQGVDIGTLRIPWLSDPAQSSGALIVGAGGAGTSLPEVPALQIVPGSNWGSRVDLQGVGAGVVTTGYPQAGAPENASYTACFDGTSSASATIAAAVADLQSAVIARRGTPLTPPEVRSLLQSTGLSQTVAPGTTLQNIGPRPQVAAALAQVISIGPPPSGSSEAAKPTQEVKPPVTTPITPAPPATATTAIATATPAATGLTASFDRAHRRLTVRLRGVARAATVRVGSRRATVRAGLVVLRGVRPGRIVIRVAAGAGYAAVSFRVEIRARAATRVERL